MLKVPTELDPRKYKSRLTSKLKLSSSVLLASILLLALLGAGSGDISLALGALALGAVALAAFFTSAIRVTQILSAVRFASENLHNLARPSSSQPRAGGSEDDDPIRGLLDTPGLIAERIEGATGEIERLREIDPITGLGNRWWLQTRGRQEFGRALRESRPISMIVVKILRLEGIDAEFGHHAANTALLSVADTLRDFVRPYDLVGRVAADQFDLILPGADLDAATEIARRLQKAIGSRTIALIGDRCVDASVAVVEKQAEDSWFDEFFERGYHELGAQASDSPLASAHQ
jgi:diguanylate cyclase (GGDEF)-like protein